VCASLQDAGCKVPSDWLDQGQSDLNVPTVPDGFMREVVIHRKAYTQPSSAARPAPTVFYHFFQFRVSEGPIVQRKALLRAAVNPDNADAEDTVEGFLRSPLNDPGLGLRGSDFRFHGVEEDSPVQDAARSAALPAAHPAQPSTSVQPRAAPSAGKSLFIGGALKCCGCGRWHHVPDKVMHEVRCSLGVLWNAMRGCRIATSCSDWLRRVQAKQKGGGRSFMCAQSSAWRKDFKCSESSSDFMTAGEHFGVAIPAVPKGFVRWVQLRRINEPSERRALKVDRSVYYTYCGDGGTVPDTAGWEPLGEQMAAAMADKLGLQRIYSLRPREYTNNLSVEKLLKQNPVLVSAGVTLDNFSFTTSSARLSRRKEQPPSFKTSSTPIQSALQGRIKAARPPTDDELEPATFPLEGGALKCCGCERWHNVPENVMHKVRCPLGVL